MRFAVLSDVHGNVIALEAVLADLNSRSVDAVLNLGDHVSGPLWPQETAELLASQDWVHLRGNHDRAVSETPESQLGLSDGYAFHQSGEAAKAWLAALPATWTLGTQVSAFHGSPVSDSQYLLETISGGRKVLRERGEIEQLLAGPGFEVFLCGHSHIPRLVRLSSGSLVLNPGSVGLQAYEEGDPVPYRVETGAPHARYALLEKVAGIWSVEFRLVSYDWEKAAHKAERAQRPDWAVALRSGFSR